jgi:hypothetical protein
MSETPTGPGNPETTAGTTAPANEGTGSAADAEPVQELQTTAEEVDHEGTGPGDTEGLPPSEVEDADEA